MPSGWACPQCQVPGAARKEPICSTGPPSAPKLRQPCLGPGVGEGTMSTCSCTHRHVRQAQDQPQRRVDPGTPPPSGASPGHLGAWRAGTLTAEDLVVAPPEVRGPGRPVVELVPVGGQDEPEERARRRGSGALERPARAAGRGFPLVIKTTAPQQSGCTPTHPRGRKRTRPSPGPCSARGPLP